MKATYVLGGYTEWTVPRAVAPVIEASWTYAFRGACTATGSSVVHRVLPHTGVSLVVHGRRDAGTGFRALGLQLQGASERHRFFRPDGDTVLVAVRVRPEWIRAVAGMDASEVKDRIVDLDTTASWRSVFSGLRRRSGMREVLTALEDLVHDRLAEVRADGAGIAAHRALERFRVDPTGSRVAAVAAATGVSERTLRRSVTTITGMSPKWIHRVERLTRAVTAADRARRPSWSEMARRFGFSDQAHLVREARTITGCTPAALHRERRQQHRIGRPAPLARATTAG